MLKRLNQFLADFYALKARIEGATDAALMRKVLGSIDPAIPFKEPTGSDRKDFLARVETVYADMSAVITAMIEEEKNLIATQDTDVSFSRGTMNGLLLAKEKFDLWHGEFIETKKRDGAPLIGGVIPIVSSSPFPGSTPGENERS